MAHLQQWARCLGQACRCRQGPCPVCRCPPPFPMPGMMSPPFPMPGMTMPHADLATG